ncbi:MAG TPA: diiron oxygenase [Gammaproteobacteria bacterium]|nr:diiron oxygenase [Gammaproteobacteria bacterium]
MLYPELFKSLEKLRWNMETDVPWGRFDPAQLSDEQAQTIKMNAITEWSALPATEMFLRDNREDSDFSAFMSIWFYEEQKHSLVLQEYLRRFRPDLLPTEEELHAVRFEFDPAPPLETLMMHFCGEIRLTHWYQCASEWHTEPVIKYIYDLISKDEARHGGCYRRFMERAIEQQGDTARMAFARMGVLMASIRTGNALHPTNLHVNKQLYPKDRVQDRVPEPGWIEHWLNEQIRFDKKWQQRVIDRILNSLSLILKVKLESVRDLQQYRKQLAA